MTMSATATSAGAAASTASDGAVYSGFGGGSGGGSGGSSQTGSASSDNAAGRLVLNFGELYGLGVVAAGIFFGFTTLL